MLEQSVADAQERLRKIATRTALRVTVFSFAGEDDVTLRNPFETDLVYLMGGESVPLDVLDYPTLGKRFLLLYDGGFPPFYELRGPSKPFALAEPTGRVPSLCPLAMAHTENEEYLSSSITA